MKRIDVSRLDACLWTVAIVLFICSVPGSAQDENRPTTVPHETGFYYTVEKGDTLWDISERFADAPWYWPELWEKNSQIANPHRIFPGDRLRLFYSEGVDTILPTVSPKEEVVVEAPPEPAYFAFAGNAIDRIGFVRKADIEPSGRVLRGKFKRSLYNKGDQLLLEPQGAIPFAAGVEYFTYRVEETLTDPETNAYLGRCYLITGIVRIVSVKSDFAVAEVVQSFREIESDNLLMPYFPKESKIMLTESTPGIQGRIIGSEFPRQQLLGQYHVVFIDKGARDGIRPGQFYELYREPEDNIIDASLEYVPAIKVPRGQLLVVLTQPYTATALITGGIREIDSYSHFQTPASQ